MSMYQIEDFIELAVSAVAYSALPVPEKRDLIYTLFILEGCGDCGFTHRRTTRQMVISSYTFLFDKTEMWDYDSNADFYEELFEKGIFSNGDIYAYEDDDNSFPSADGKICVDSGSPAWEAMVAAGKITGDGAKPVTRLSSLETLRTVKFLIEKQEGVLDSDMFDGFAMLFMLSDAANEANALANPDEVYLELLGITREQAEDDDFENFEPPAPSEDDSDVCARVFRLNKSLIPFAIDCDFSPDRSLVLKAYKSTLPYITEKDGQKRHITIRYIPKGWPARFNIFARDENPVLWLETIGEDLEKLDEYTDNMLILKRLSESDECKKIVDIEKFERPIAILSDENTTSKTLTLSRLTKLLDTMSSCWREADFPQEFIDESDPMTIFLAAMEGSIDYFSRLIEQKKESEEYGTACAALKRFSDIIKTRLERHIRVISEKYPKSPKDIRQCEELIDELDKLSQSPPQQERGVRGMEIAWGILRSPGANVRQRWQYAGQLVCALLRAVDYVDNDNEKILNKKMYMPQSPDVISKLESRLAQFDRFPPQKDCVITVKHDDVGGVIIDSEEPAV